MISVSSAISAFNRAMPSIAPEEEALPKGVTNAANEFARVMQGIDTTSTAAMTGKADTHDLVQAIAHAEVALETAVAIRDKVVEAYQEILRMPV